MNIQRAKLQEFTANIFAAAGCAAEEAGRIGHYLTEANLVGHDSHGVIRVPSYIDWLKAGKVVANRTIRVDFENEVIAVVDGQYGFGQSIGEQATKYGIEKCAGQGVAVVALRNAGHLGRIGDWPLLAARSGLVSLHFVNTSGMGILVAPFGGKQRRLSADPIAAGVPVAGGEPILLDMSSCTIAEGKLRVAFNKGVSVPEGCIIDAEGKPTTDPKVFYADPPGAILPIAGHKGYALGFIVEMMAGALTGGGASNPNKAGRLANGMLSIYMDPKKFRDAAEFATDVEQFIAWVKSCPTQEPGGEILVPGDIEVRTKAQRLERGIELDDNTWQNLVNVAHELGVQNPDR